MHRFFVPIDRIQGESCVISGSDAEHARVVLRLKKGDKLQVCDGFGSEYLGEIERIDRDIQVRFLEKLENRAEPQCKVTLYQGIPKQSKMELIVQKCVELGVQAVVPVSFGRCVAKPAQEQKKRERWQKIAQEAAKQSGRGIIPQVAAPASFQAALDQMASHELLIVCYENETEKSLRSLLTGQKDVGLVIGPEGGLEAAEVEAMRQIGGTTITLGRRILRTETAGMAVLSGIMFFAGEME